MLSQLETEKLLQKIGQKIRGFEYISEEQWDKDCPNITESTIIKPKRSTAKSAGYDFFAPFQFELQPGESIKIPTGIKVYMMNDEVLKIYPRSSLGFKYFTRLANSCAIIDSDYFNNPNNEGHIWIKIRNEGDTPLVVKEKEAFCQGIFQKYLLIDDDSYDGNERIGGIGSTNQS